MAGPGQPPDADAVHEKVLGLRFLSRELLVLAWPQMVVLLCRNVISLTDVAVVGRLGTAELAAVAYAQIILNLSGTVLWSGFGDALLTLTSQAIGAGNPKLCGVWLQLSFLFMLAGSVPIAATWWFAGDILASVPRAPSRAVCDLAAVYARYSIAWLFPDAVFSAFCQWLMGQRQVRPTIPIHAAFVGVNLGANVLLVHGAGPYWSGLGFAGSPLATAFTKVLRGLALVYYVCHVRRLHAPYWPGWDLGAALDPARVERLAAQSLPSAVVGVVEQFQFVIITLMVGSLSTAKLAAHAGILNVFSVVTCGLYGLADAAASTIGGYLGERRPSAARRTSRAVFAVMGGIGLCVGALFLAARSGVGRIFSRDPAVWGYAANLSLIVGGAYAALSVLFACFATLQGQARPQIAAVSMFFGLWGVSVPMSYVFAFPLSLGLNGIWFGLSLGYLLVSVIMASFVLTSDWEKFAKDAATRSERGGAAPAAPAGEPLGAPLLAGDTRTA